MPKVYEKVMTSVHFTSARTGTGRDDWRTPKALFDMFNEQYGLFIDAGTSKENALCRQWIGPGGYIEDALGEKPWWKRPGWETPHNVWLNPPYSKMGEFLTRAVIEQQQRNIGIVVALVPARTDTKVWHEVVMKFGTGVHLIKGRLRFSESKNSAPFPSAVIVFDPHRNVEKPELFSLEQPR